MTILKSFWDFPWFTPKAASVFSNGHVYHVDQLTADFVERASRKCDTRKALEISTAWFGTRRSMVQIHSPRPLTRGAVRRHPLQNVPRTYFTP